MIEKKFAATAKSSSTMSRGMNDTRGFGPPPRDSYRSSNGYGGGGSGYRNGGNNSFGGGNRSGGGYGGGFGGGYGRRQQAPVGPPPADLPVYKNFYKENPATAKRPQFEINQWMSANSVTFRGQHVLNPILQFNELNGLPDGVMYSIQKQGFTTPTVIQSAAWPLALSGRDLVGIAQTGSGKTLAYALPALVHVEGNSHRRKYGPSVLILAPTRELAQQIKDVVNMFRTRAVCIFGGASKPGQRRELDRTQASIIIACPGRLIDFVEEGTITLQNITYLVLDEADRMLDMGFEPQIRKIVDQIPKNRQTLMWSATWPKEVRRLAEDFLVGYIQVNIGSVSLAANHNITQIIDICEESEKINKLYKLLSHVQANNRENKTIIFAETKRKVDQLNQQMRSNGWHASAIHGDKPQTERDWALNEFKSGRNPILIATDVAARGLDVDDIKYVVNFDYPSCSEDYVHRIGRTGRRDKKGTSYTFFTLNNCKQAGDLIDVLKEANQTVPSKLYEFASQAHRYGKNVRRRYGGGGQYGGNGYRSFGGNNYGNGFQNNRAGSGGSYGGGMKRKYDDYGGGARGGGFNKKPNYGAGTHSSSGPIAGAAVNGGGIGGGGASSGGDRYNHY